MAKKQKKSLNPNRVTLAMVSLLMIIFLIWSVRSCSSGNSEYAMVAEAEARQNYLDRLQHAEDSLAVISAAQAEARARQRYMDSLRRTLPLDSNWYGNQQRVVTEKVTVLYVTFEGLNVRSGPGTNYGRVDRLKLFDAVTFMNEVTDSSYQINLGEVTPNEPWVKIQTPSGKTGWVYGAGVHYYKRKLEGVVN